MVRLVERRYAAGCAAGCQRWGASVMRGGLVSSGEGAASARRHAWMVRLGTGVLSFLCLAAVVASSAGAEEAQAADGPPLDIAILMSSRNDVCYDPGDVAAVKKL